MADFADAVHRWKGVVGANHLSVLIVEPNVPEKLMHDFENLLSLPQGFFANEKKPQQTVHSLIMRLSSFVVLMYVCGVISLLKILFLQYL